MSSLRQPRIANLVRILTIVGAGLAAAALSFVGGAEAWTFKSLYSFCAKSKCHDGYQIWNGLTMDQLGRLYGTATYGGRQEHGTAFKLTPQPDGGYDYKRLYAFCSEAGCGTNPFGQVVLDVKGNLYGSSGGGANNLGVVFELSPQSDGSGWDASDIHSFCSESDCADGVYPGPLTYFGASKGEPYNGKRALFGVTVYDSYHSPAPGSVFKLKPGPAGWTLETIYKFSTDSYPLYGLVMDESGNLYGVSIYDGANKSGTVFELSFKKGTWSKTVIHDFCAQPECADGGRPGGTLFIDQSGILYGVVVAGTASGDGGVFKVVPNGEQSQFTLLHSFCALDCTDGRNPQGQVAVDDQGNVFGTTSAGGFGGFWGEGTIFEIDGTGLQTIHTFCSGSNCVDGSGPASGVIMDGAGNLFGTTTGGGKYGGGAVFELMP